MLYIPNVTYFQRQILDVTQVSAFRFLTTMGMFDVVQEFPTATEGSRGEKKIQAFQTELYSYTKDSVPEWDPSL
jgi:hypothetical protein